MCFIPTSTVSILKWGKTFLNSNGRRNPTLAKSSGATSEKNLWTKLTTTFTATFIFGTYQGERLIQEETESLKMSYYTYPHLRALFLLTGLEIVEKYGSFEKTPLD
jgi:hypothetical protein